MMLLLWNIVLALKVGLSLSDHPKSLALKDGLLLPDHLKSSPLKVGSLLSDRPKSLVLKIVLLAFDRPQSTIRCLNSLRAAFYPPGIRMPLHIRIDRHPDGTENRQLRYAVHAYEWPFGKKTILVHEKHVGLREQWLSVPVDDVTLILEDDIVVSPFYYHILLAMLKGSLDEVRLFGIALQKPQWQMGMNEHGKWRRLDAIAKLPLLFTFPAPATWGFVTFPNVWQRFVRWGRDFMKDGRYTKGALTTKWIRERRESSLISPLIFEYLLEWDLSIAYLWLGNSTVLTTARSPLEGLKGSIGQHYGDSLLEDANAALQIVSDLQSGLNTARFSICMDRIEVDNNSAPCPVIWAAKDETEMLDLVLRHLRNVCRIVRVSIQGHFDPMAFHVTDYAFDCSLFRKTGYALQQQVGVRCNYTVGLYPDSDKMVD